MNKRDDCGGKRGRLIRLAVLCAAAVFALAACGVRPTAQERVLAAFQGQEELICEKISRCRAGDKVEWDDLEGVLRVQTHLNGVIEFECVAEGILTASVDAGFYYSPDDRPCVVGWLHGELTEDGNGYSYSDGTDNRYYTERLRENFYYYIVRN